MTVAGDAVWMDVLPNLKRFATDLAKGSTKAATDVGKSSGVAWAKSFKGAAGDSGSKAVVAELETAAKRTKRVVEDQTAAIAKARAAQKDAAAKVVEAEQRLADARAKGDTAKVEAAELRLGASRDRLESASTKALSVEDQLKAAHREHKTVVGQLEQATKDLAEETDTSATAAGRARESFNQTGKSLGGMAVKLAAAAGGVALLSQAWSTAAAGEKATDALAASLDLTAEQSARAGEVAGGLYAQAYGSSIEDVTGAVGAVMSSVSGLADAPAGALEEVAKGALNLAEIFGVDVQDSARNLGVWIKTGLVDDAQQGLDLMTASLQKVPQALRGEVLDASHEYATFFAQLGLDGTQAMGLLVSASEGGQYAVDKTGDALKELTIRATDMSATSVSAYQAAGLSAEDMSARFLAGGDEAAGALSDLVTGLQGIEDPTKRANAAIALFGTPLEDLGTENIPTFLASLSGVGGGLGDVTGAAAEADEVLNDNLATSMESLKRGFMDTVSEGIEPFIGPATSFLKWAQDTPGVMTAVAVALGVVALAWTAVTLAASPWLAIGVAVALVIGGIILAVQNWGAIVDWLREKWEPVGAWFAGIWEAVKTAVGTAWQWVVDKLTEGWNWVDRHVFGPIRFGLTLVGLAFQLYQAQVMRVWDGIRTAAGAAWDWVKTNVFDNFVRGVDVVGQAFSRTGDWIARAWEKVKEAAAAPVRFVVNTVYRDGIKATWDKIAGAVGLDLKLPTITLPFAEGGVLEDHRAQVAPAGAWRVWAEPETGGEAYIPLAPAKRARSMDVLEQVADRFGARLVPYAGGGFWDRAGGFVSGVGSRARDLVTDVAGFLADPANAIRNLITAPVSQLLSQVGGGRLGQMLVELPGQVIAAVVAKAKELVTGAGAGGWVRPSAGPVTSEYGPRWGAFHAGIDIAGGGPTYAAAAGTVARTGWGVVPGRTGIGILLAHGTGSYTYYGHNPVGGVKVTPGQAVTAGQRIGAQGDTGNVTGVHLHFEAHRGGLGNTVNPRSLGVFDNGGYLPPGVSVVENRTGSPEPVLTDQQWDALVEGRSQVRLDPRDLDYLAAALARTILPAAQRVAEGTQAATARSVRGSSQVRGPVW